jgi:hypothetical protein
MHTPFSQQQIDLTTDSYLLEGDPSHATRIFSESLHHWLFCWRPAQHLLLGRLALSLVHPLPWAFNNINLVPHIVLCQSLDCARSPCHPLPVSPFSLVPHTLNNESVAVTTALDHHMK